MRLTTRRVTAQRKFAQGAFVPPTVAAAVPNNNAPTTSTDRRETLPTSNDRSSIFHNNMSAKGLLDVVCFQGSHTHMEPIVLVERLRGKNIRDDKEQRQVAVNGERVLKVIENVRSKRKIIKRRQLNQSNQHLMTLRTREQRNSPRWLVDTASWRRNVSIQKSRKTIPPKNNLPKKLIPKRSKRKSSESSLDDNRPLKYFAKCSTPKASTAAKSLNILGPSANVHSVMGPPKIIPPPPPPQVVKTTHTGLEVIPEAKSEDVTNSVNDVESSVSPVLQSKGPKAVNRLTVSEYFYELHGTPSPSINRRPDDQPSTSEVFNPERSPPVNYYSEQGIHRWMNDSLSEERTTPPRTQQEPLNNITQFDDDDAPPESVIADICTATPWKTVYDVVKSTKSDFDSRCTVCKQCERIEKVIKLTALLKRQRRIDCLPDEENNPRRNKSSRTTDDKGESSNGNLDIISELLPRHPHLMIKMTVRAINGKKKYAACLIPRSEATGVEVFNMSENEYILDEVIETLSLNLGDPPCNLIRSKSPIPSVSRFKDKTAAIEEAECSTSFEKKTENNGTILPAPIFWPSREDFVDPIKYIEKIWDQVVDCGICKIIPPTGFVAHCKTDDDIRFEVTNQYISRLYNRWGPSAREMCAIKACLKAQNISIQRPPLLEGIEVNLSKLYHTVQRHGGLENVINKKKWGKVADEMKLNKNPMIERKLDAIYFKYLLPYDTLSAEERQEFIRKVESAWTRKNQKLLDRAGNPLHRQKRLLGDSDLSSDETEDDETEDIEDCVKRGMVMDLAKFKKIARIAFDNFFRDEPTHPRQIEEEYWRRVTQRTEHICVHSASVDTREQGLGFQKSKDHDKLHPWNLKALSENPSNILRSLGPVLGVTVPTLHLGMVYSTSCWHRDPHSIAWVEYLHQGSVKIWYGVSEQQDLNFRRGTVTLNPTACQNKSLWLSSDIAMIPPDLLRQENVKVYRVEQMPGEYVLVMPRAYSCSVSTGYSVSESTYFATERWLDNLKSVFSEIRESCEPTMFALEQLLKNIAEDPNAKPSVLRKIKPILETVFKEEIDNRDLLINKGVKLFQNLKPRADPRRAKRTRNFQPQPPPVWNVREQDECEICRCTLYLSKVKNIPQANSMVCLEHALKLLSKKKYANVKASDLEMYYAFNTEELQNTIKTIQRRVGPQLKRTQTSEKPTRKRTVRRKTRKVKSPTWNQNQLQQAIQAIITQEMRFTQAAAHFGIPKGTLYDNILGKGHRMVILDEIGTLPCEENAIIEFCCDLKDKDDPRYI